MKLLQKFSILILSILLFSNCFKNDPKFSLEDFFVIHYITCNVFKVFCFTPPVASNNTKKTVCKSCSPQCKMSTDFGLQTCTTGYQRQNTGGTASVSVNITTGALRPGVSYDPSKCDIWQSVQAGTQGAEACGVQLSTNTYPKCYIEGCQETMEITIPKTTAIILGYDLTASDPPVGVKSINPSSSQIIYEDQNLSIQFAGSVKSDSISFSGSMNPELNPNFRFGRTVDYNDTLPLAASSKWSLGAAKTLNISVLDLNDNPVTVPLLYHVIKTGSSKTPSFNECSGGCKPGWQNAYSIQFNATGGVPPYRWTAASSLPPEANVPSGSLPPGASMTQNGLLSGPATNNFMPNAVYVFGVAVIDSVGQIDVKIITIDTTDVGAQLAACLLLGLCG